MLLDLFEYKNGSLILKKKRAHGAKVGDVVGTLQKTGYLAVNLERKPQLVHRLIFLMHHGYLPPCTDHIDGNRLNNKIENLRPATRTENNRNIGVQKNNKLGVKGVTAHQGGFRARICVDRKTIELGSYKKINEAKNAYDNAARLHHGEFANLGVTP